PPISTLFPYTTLFRSFQQIDLLLKCVESRCICDLQVAYVVVDSVDAIIDHIQQRDHAFDLLGQWSIEPIDSFFECAQLRGYPVRSEEHTSELQSLTNI